MPLQDTKGIFGIDSKRGQEGGGKREERTRRKENPMISEIKFVWIDACGSDTLTTLTHGLAETFYRRCPSIIYYVVLSFQNPDAGKKLLWNV